MPAGTRYETTIVLAVLFVVTVPVCQIISLGSKSKAAELVSQIFPFIPTAKANSFRLQFVPIKVVMDRMKLSKRVASNLFDQAKGVFGITENWKEAGYILPDGSLLDFSGKKHGGSANQRSQDHREVEQLMESRRTAAMHEFMRDGAIRIQYGIGLEIVKAPSPPQYGRISEFVAIHGGEVSIDLADGIGKRIEPKKDDPYYSFEARTFDYPTGTRASKVLSSIRAFFGQ